MKTVVYRIGYRIGNCLRSKREGRVGTEGDVKK